MALLRIGEVARQANVNVQTLRFYEREGLLPAPQRRASSGYREYSPDVIRLVRFIQRAQKLGFSLREVKELLALCAIPEATCGDVLSLAQKKRDEIRAKLRDLRTMYAAVTTLIKGCPGGKNSITKCPIVAALAGDG